VVDERAAKQGVVTERVARLEDGVHLALGQVAARGKP
jgi:hypothetical protein